MKKLILVAALIMLSSTAYAGEKEHLMQVHGAVCSSCAYGLEKKFMKIDGVKAFDVDFKAGIVSVCADENVDFAEEDLTTLFKQSGYTYKGEEIKDTCT
tara:strand:+ start:231 stop:527 length:297 start_codon:yes stop_codon:yes gene_type:complete